MTQRYRAPRANRTIGVIYLLYFVSAILSMSFLKSVAVRGNLAATAHNIVLHETSFRASFALNLIATACYVALTALLYGLFAPVNKAVSLVASFLSLMGCAVQTVGSLFQLAPLAMIGGNTSMATPDTQQLQTLWILFLKLQAQAFNVGLVFFALYCILIGYLILRSSLLPWPLGAFVLAAGIGWLTFLFPPFAARISSYTQILGFLAEFSLMLWLLIRGVDTRVVKMQEDAPVAAWSGI